MMVLPINKKNPSKVRSDNLRTLKKIRPYVISFIYFEDPNSQNLPLTQEPTSLNFPRREKFLALQKQSCHIEIKCLKLFSWFSLFYGLGVANTSTSRREKGHL